jgi:hypothetical protein
MVISWMGVMQLPCRPRRDWARVMVAAALIAQAPGIGQLPLLGLIGTLMSFIFLLRPTAWRRSPARRRSRSCFGARHYGAIADAVVRGANGARAIGQKRRLRPVGRARLLSCGPAADGRLTGMAAPAPWLPGRGRPIRLVE